MYENFIYYDKLISPETNYSCKIISKQNIKLFGFDSINDLLNKYPEFPLKCKETIEKRLEGDKQTSKSLKNKLSKVYLEYTKNPKNCLNCNITIDYKHKVNNYCSHKCSTLHNSKIKKYKHSTETKEKLSFASKKYYEGNKEKIKLFYQYKKNMNKNYEKPNTLCVICNNDTNSIKNKTCSKECYTKLRSIISQKHPNCGGQKQTHRSKIYNINGECFNAESSYEVRVSNSLNENNILWIRPKFLWYIDSINNKRRYYPDFYLPEFDLYLDPKNNYLIDTDIEKIYKASEYNNVRIFILGKNYLDYKSFENLVGNEGNALSSSVRKTEVLLLN